MEFQLTQNVINRMKKACDFSRGVRITAEELAEMKLTIFGEIWEQDDPCHLTSHQSRAADVCACDFMPDGEVKVNSCPIHGPKPPLA